MKVQHEQTDRAEERGQEQESSPGHPHGEEARLGWQSPRLLTATSHRFIRDNFIREAARENPSPFQLSFQPRTIPHAETHLYDYFKLPNITFNKEKS